MDTVEKYRRAINQTLSFYAQTGFGFSPGLEMRATHDPKTDDFFLVMIGWENHIYRHGMLMHLQIVDGKIWLHENRTDFDLLERLYRAGVPKSDIVLGFVEPILREEGEFAMA